jgi:CBS domain-containing protein
MKSDLELLEQQGERIMQAAEIMTEDPMTIGPQGRIRDAIEILQALEIRHLPVVNERGALIGMLSDRDLRNAAIPYTLLDTVKQPIGNVLERRVSDVMSADVTSIGPETEVEEIIDVLLELKVGALPVVDGDTGDLLGIVSYVDVLRALRTAA